MLKFLHPETKASCFEMSCWCHCGVITNKPRHLRDIYRVHTVFQGWIDMISTSFYIDLYDLINYDGQRSENLPSITRHTALATPPLQPQNTAGQRMQRGTVVSRHRCHRQARIFQHILLPAECNLHSALSSGNCTLISVVFASHRF